MLAYSTAFRSFAVGSDDFAMTFRVDEQETDALRRLPHPTAPRLSWSSISRVVAWSG